MNIENDNKMNILRIATFISLITFTGAAFFVRKSREQQKIHVEDVIEHIQTSITSCNLQCRRLERCTGYGTLTDSMLGQLVDCFLLGDGRKKYSGLPAHHKDDWINMFVVGMVCIVIVITPKSTMAMFFFGNADTEPL